MRVSRDYRLGAGVLGVELLLSGIYFLFPSNDRHAGHDLRDVRRRLLSLAIVWGIRRWRPEPRLPWFVFAAANMLFVAGDIAFDISPNAATPAVADYLYLIAYPLFAALPVMLIIALRHPPPDRLR